MAKVFVAISVFSLVLIGTDSEKCQQQNSCVCAFSEYSKYDLTGLLGNDPKKTDFISDRNGNYTVYYHGCKDGEFDLELAINNTCKLKETTIVLVNYSNPHNITCTNVGSNKAVRFNEADDHTVGAYELDYVVNSTGDKKPEPQVVASVRLVCNNVPEPYIKIHSIQEQPALISLWLNSPHACVYSQHPGMSRGSVLLIIFLIVVALYFIGGALVLYFIRGARGTELIPNVDFWRSLPGLVKDGCIYMLSGCNAGALSSPDSYDRI